jgi:hypothetical protein
MTPHFQALPLPIPSHLDICSNIDAVVHCTEDVLKPYLGLGWQAKELVKAVADLIWDR